MKLHNLNNCVVISQFTLFFFSERFDNEKLKTPSAQQIKRIHNTSLVPLKEALCNNLQQLQCINHSFIGHMWADCGVTWTMTPSSSLSISLWRIWLHALSLCLLVPPTDKVSQSPFSVAPTPSSSLKKNPESLNMHIVSSRGTAPDTRCLPLHYEILLSVCTCTEDATSPRRRTRPGLASKLFVMSQIQLVGPPLKWSFSVRGRFAKWGV